MGNAVYQRRWRDVPSFTRSSDSQFTVTDNSENQARFTPGRYLRYRATSGTWRYGQIKSYDTGTITILGHPLTISDDDEMQVGYGVGVVKQLVFPGNCTTGDPYNDLVFRWRERSAFCIGAICRVDVAPVGANINLTVEINNTAIFSSNISLSTADTNYDSGVTITNTAYDIQKDEPFHINISQVGSSTPGGNALYVDLVFVFPD